SWGFTAQTLPHRSERPARTAGPPRGGAAVRRRVDHRPASLSRCAAMRLLCVLNGGAEHPSTRFRVLQHLDRLRAHGIEPETLIAKRDEGYGPIALRRRAAKSDAVLIQ